MNTEGISSSKTALGSIVQRVTSSTGSISDSISKLNTILSRLRGLSKDNASSPTPVKEPDDNHLDRLGYQMDSQTELLNMLHNQIDELSSII